MEESEFINVQGKWGKNFVEIPNPVKPGEIARFKLTPELVGNPPPEYWNKTDLREAAQMALDALESGRVFVTSREKIKHPEGTEWYDERIEALRAVLAQPVVNQQLTTEQEPVAWRHWLQVDGEQFPQLTLVPRTDKDEPLYTAPPQREWQKLTDGELRKIIDETGFGMLINVWFDKHDGNPRKVLQAIEAKLMEKNFDRPS